MLRIQVSGFAGEGKSEVIDIVKTALKANGKRVLTVADGKVDAVPGRDFDVVIYEQTTIGQPTMSVDFDFLVGRTEAAAYELVQEQGYTAKVTSRNGIPMIGNANVNLYRVNLTIVDNTVVGWSIG